MERIKLGLPRVVQDSSRIRIQAYTQSVTERTTLTSSSVRRARSAINISSNQRISNQKFSYDFFDNVFEPEMTCSQGITIVGGVTAAPKSVTLEIETGTTR